MKTKKLTRAATVFFMFLLCMSSVVRAQIAGPGVDPDVIMLDDFESGSTSKWTPRPGSRGEKMSFELMNAANGDLVRFGNYALKVNIDFTDAQENQTLTAQISPGTSGEALQIPGNASGGKMLGMWVYATPGVEGMWLRVSTRPIGSTSGVTNTDLASKINWTGWKYVQCKLPAKHEFHPDGIRLLVLKGYPNYFANGYVIIDNIRVTNQSFTEDLTPPAITGLTGNGKNLTGTFTTTQIDLAATFNEQGSPVSGINYNSIRMIVDGYDFKAGDAGFAVDNENNKVSLADMNLSNGMHNVVVHVEDNFGNIAENTATFTIDASDGKSTAVTVESAPKAYVGTPFEIKINTNNSKDVKELELVMEFNNIGSVDAVNGVTFAESARNGSSYEFNPRNGYLTINLKNDITAGMVETLATIKVNISKNSNPTDILRCSPVSAKAVYADNSLSLFSLFKAFANDVLASYNFTVNKRIVGAPGEVLVTDLDGSPLSGATVYALNSKMTEVVASAVTGPDGIASEMDFTSTAQSVNVYAEKDGKYSYTKLVRTLNPLLTNVPEYISAGTTADPSTSKTITWMANPVQAADPSIMRLAKKSEGEEAFREFAGTTKILEYNAVVSNGVTKGSSVTVDNLEPGTTYIYQVGDGVNWSSTREFTTTAPTKKFSFSAFGDLQASSNNGMNRYLAAAETIEAMPERPLFNLNVGDVVDSDDRYDCYSYYGYLFNQRPVFSNIDIISGYGNHEYMGNPDADNVKFMNGHHHVDPSDKYDSKLVGTGSYAAEYGNMLVLALDWEHRGGGATPSAIMEETAKWMDDVLSKTDKTWKIVTLHYPIFPSASTPGSQGIFGPILDKHNVQIVFCGHGHTYERVQIYQGNNLVPPGDKRTFEPAIGGTMHIQLGDMTSTGRNARWLHCDVDGKKMTVTVRDANNSVVENECFTLYASPVNEYPVTFNTVSGEGTLTATVDGTEITSGSQVQEGKDVVFTATPDASYKVKEWRLNNTVVNETETTYTLSDLSAAATVTVAFDIKSGVDDLSAQAINVYPNPFEDKLQIAGAEDCTLKVIDVAGTVVHVQKITGENDVISLERFLSGVYFFHIEKDKQVKIVRVMKK